MPTYQCSNGHKFVHAAKHTVTKPFTFNIKVNDSAANGEGDSIGEYGLQQGLDVTETPVCPICHSLEYSEYKEPEGEYVDWAKVSHEEVTAKLQAGWTVLSHTKDNVVMAKPKAPAEKDYITEAIEASHQ